MPFGPFGDFFGAFIGGPLSQAYDLGKLALTGANAFIANETRKNPSGAAFLLAGGILGVISGGTGALATIGVSLGTAGAVQIAMGAIFRTAPLEDPRRDSPTYGFSDFANRATGDICVPVVYSNDTAAPDPGHKVAPIYVMAYVTPRGYEDVEFARTKATTGQAVSCLFAVAEGPVELIDDVRINGEPVWEAIRDRPTEEKANGTRKQFTLACQNPDLFFLDVKVAGVSKGWARSTVTNVIGTGSATSTKTVYRWVLPDYDGGQQEIDQSAEIVFYRGWNISSANALSVDPDAELRPIAWLESANVLLIWTQRPLQNGEVLQAAVPIRKLSGLRATYLQKEKHVRLDFETAPASGAAVTCSVRRKALASVRVEYRLGASHQLPIDGFDQVRNEVAVGQNIVKGAADITFQADEAVDDLVLDIAALSGLCAFDNDDGSVEPRSVEIAIDWKPEGGTAWYQLRDPADTAGTKTATTFRLSGKSTSAVYFAFSIRQLLAAWCAKNKGDKTAAAELAAMVRGKLSARVRRTTATPSDPLVRDVLTLVSYQKVLTEKLAYPGVALLAVHGVASAKLQGGLPQVTCRVRGKRDVEAWTGTAWVASATAQANPVWAAIDLITAKRYGQGEHFTKADNIDTTTALAAANWCDTLVSDGNGGTEKQGVLDLVLDTRADLMEQVARILLPHRVVPVLQGRVWKFVIDEPATLASVPVLYDDGSDGSMLRDSLTFAHQETTSEITELQLSYLDRDDDFDRNEIWVAPEAPATNRRIQRATADGIARATEAARYAKWLRSKSMQQGANLSFAMIPVGLRLEAGDVVRVVSTRLGIDLYARVLRWTIDSTESMVVRVEAAQYVPAVYGQDVAAQKVTKPTPPQAILPSAPTATVPTSTGASRVIRSGRVLLTVRRAA